MVLEQARRDSVARFCNIWREFIWWRNFGGYFAWIALKIKSSWPPCKAVPTTKKGNIPFGKADLAAIVLSSVPMWWQNQYNLNHSTVPESTRTLLLDLEAIEWVMEEKRGANLKAKAKGGTVPAEAKSNPKHKASRGPTGQVPKKGRSEKFCQQCKAHGGPFTMHNTLDCRRYDSNSKPLQAAASKPAESKKPYKKVWGPHEYGLHAVHVRGLC